MPLYEYQCGTCGRKTEVIQLFSEPAPSECPYCGGKLTKLLSTPAFQFKGTGFYSTDYGKAGRNPEDSSKEKEGDSSKGKEAEAGAPGETGAETKGSSEGDSQKEKKEKKETGTPGPSEGTVAKTSTDTSSPSEKESKKRK
jgi:putative FmdB family regulatory protein